MNQYLIDKLREGRLNKGLKQSDVTKLTGIKNTTLSNYENGVTEPDMDTFLKLCSLYGLDYAEIIREAYGFRIPGTSHVIVKSDIERIEKFHELDDAGRALVDHVIDHELKRAEQLQLLSGHQPELNAAHPRTDIDVTEEMQLHDDAVMDDDSEWE